ncbi:SWIM zinc finger domain-containing protein, partial [Acidiphilium sp. AL]|uniref:SWIM zinc finger family protein n=1 Tax=Acidiphilium sp. AL TaxID=2871704 RepID=UPI0021CB2491
MTTSRVKRSPRKAKKVQERSSGFQGWNTTDADELERRRWRGLTDIGAIENLEPEHPYFGNFRVHSTSGATYEVEIRSLILRENSCGCPDWRVNGLGTCKHIEGVLDALRRKGKRAFAAAGLAGSPRLEIFPAVDGSSAVHVRGPRDRNIADAVITRYCTAAGLLAGDTLTTLPALRSELDGLHPGTVRFSRQLESRMEEERRRRRRVEDR